MLKRPAKDSLEDGVDVKREREHKDTMNMYNKIATYENAKAVDENPPLDILLNAVEHGIKKPEKGESVVYWMRMEDLRSM